MATLKPPVCVWTGSNAYLSRLTLDCSTYQHSEYVLGQPRTEERLGDVEYTQTWTKYDQPVDMNDTEYAFARCVKSKKEAVLRNVYNEKAASRARNITENIHKKLNFTSNLRPLAVYMLIFDSVSRQHFYRNFPETISFLNENLSKGRYKGKFQLYDFVVNNAHGENTQPNMVPWLYGYNLKYHKKRLQGYSIHRPEDSWKYKETQKEALWKIYEDMGFVTLFGFDTVWDFLVKSTGREIDTDHMISNFYRASKRLFGYMDFMERQRCIGLHNAHYYSLNYLLQYHKNYQGINRFAYIHLSPGHEKSGTVIKTADYDLMLFLESILDYQKTKLDEDFVLIIASDHGKHSSEWDKMMEGFMENQLPMHVMVMNTGLVSRLQADEVLTANTHRLVSRLDWYVTMRHLAVVPYGRISPDSEVYKAWKNVTDSKEAVSVMLEKVKEDRSCKDVDIPLYYCTCMSFTEIHHVDTTGPIHDLALLAIRYLNAIRRTEGSEELCRHLSLGEVVKAGVQLIGGRYTRNYKARITLKESKNAKFEVIGLMTDREGLESIGLEDRLTVPTVYVTEEGERVELWMQLQEVNRVDVYEGLCEELALAAEITPPYCICELPFPPDRPFAHKQLTAISQLVSRVSLFLSRPGQSCKDVCLEQNKACHTWTLSLYNDERILAQGWKKKDFQPVFNLTSEENVYFRDLKISGRRREGSAIRISRKGNAWNLELAAWGAGLSCEDASYYSYSICPCY